MKNLITILLVVAICGLSFADGRHSRHGRHSHHNRGGDILPAVLVATALGMTAVCINENFYQERVIYQPVPVYQSYSRPEPTHRWIEGHYENREVRVFVPERYYRDYDEYSGTYINQCDPAHYEMKTVQEWVDGYYVNY